MSLSSGTRVGPYEVAVQIKEASAGQTGAPPSLVVVLNWGEELKRLVPVR